MRRRASPIPADIGVDISGDLLDAAGATADLEDSDASDAGLGSFQDRSARHLDVAVEDDDQDDDEAFIAATQAASNRKASVAKTKASKKGGGFQSMGLTPALLKSITRKGFTVPTPIQRKTIPLILGNDDVVGMARTGSGKTAAFAIPMIEKLKSHSVKVGVRAIIMSPSRELALQTLKHVKELGKSADLRSVLLVGGDSLEDQFSQMTTNPDIIIATPGRFCHLLAEMSLDLSSVRYVVFDEADRLFEMGFATQLHEILYALPPSRQTLLFSATLPKSLVEFAKAGLKDPRLVRLDAETKISPDLQSAFLTVKSADKEGALLHLLSDVIKMPLAESAAKSDPPANPKKRKREQSAANGTLDPPTAHSTIIFAATKHHVDYLRSLMINAGYSVSYVYGSLDQTARKIQVDNFRNGFSTILVVTDVAARGIDIPLLANVVNYDFPAQPKVFVHRVGRTARAGRRGWSYSFVQDADLPYFLDLQLFLGRAPVKGRAGFRATSFAEDLVIGAIPRAGLEPACEYVTKLLGDDEDLAAQRIVAAKGEKLYLRTRNAASAESAKRTKKFTSDPHAHETNPVYGEEEHSMADERDDLLAKISGFKPAETVFEIGKRGVTTEVGEALERQRKRMRAKEPRAKDETQGSRDAGAADRPLPLSVDDDNNKEDNASELDVEDDTSFARDDGDSSDSDAVSTNPTARRSWQDRDNFMSYAPRDSNAVEERGYGVQSGSNFVDAARGATLDLQADDTRSFAEPSKMRWDKRSKKYVARANDEDGSKGARKVMGESGQKIAASFRSGRFDAWRKANRVERMPRTGEQEARGSSGGGAAAGRGKGRRFKHYAERAPKRPDVYRDDYQQQKKRYDEARARTEGGGGKGELRGVEEVRKQRELKQKRMEKNARPSKKAKGKRRS